MRGVVAESIRSSSHAKLRAAFHPLLIGGLVESARSRIGLASEKHKFRYGKDMGSPKSSQCARVEGRIPHDVCGCWCCCCCCCWWGSCLVPGQKVMRVAFPGTSLGLSHRECQRRVVFLGWPGCSNALTVLVDSVSYQRQFL